MKRTINISDRAVMVRISVHQWGMSKQDKEKTAEVNLDNGSKTLKVTKALVTKVHREKLSKVLKFKSDIEKKYTIPATGAFSGEGFKVVPIALYEDFLREMGKCKNMMAEFAADFAANLEQIKYDASKESGSAYNPEDYPDKWTIEGKFSIEFTTFPVPNGYHLPVSQDELDRMQAEIEDFHKRTFNASMRHLFKELLTPIQHASEILLDEKSKIHTSVQENLEKVIEILPRLNIYGDTTLNELVEKAKKLFESSPVAFCRNSSIIRNHTGSEAQKLADEISAKMANYDF